jgi:DNA-binding NtrC family response regulator
MFQAMPVIIISGEMTGKTLPAVADAAFSKPLDFNKLLTCIDQLLAARQQATKSA